MARTQSDGASVSLICREFQINTIQLFSWCKRFGDEALAGGSTPSQLVVVTVLDAAPASAPVASAIPGIIMLSLDQASCAWRTG
ncbi:hypothetical protein CSQ91_02195 [Janthinobacterium sp. BJB301]|nr:hypothetical protein CSQ91_02195 [Janthinobacterium sp. BJB301]